MKVQHLSRSQDSVITKAQKNILLPISGQHPGVANPQQLQGCNPVRHLKQQYSKYMNKSFGHKS